LLVSIDIQLIKGN